jgi:hypothetical protein
VPARRLAVAPALFGEPRTGRARAALERSLRVLRGVDALTPEDQLPVAVLRTMVETFDRDARRHDVSVFALAQAAREIVAEYNSLRGNAPLLPPAGDDVDDLVAALSTPASDTP